MHPVSSIESFIKLASNLGYECDVSFDRDIADVTTFGEPSRTYLTGTTYLLTYRGPRNGTVSAHTVDSLLAAALKEML